MGHADGGARGITHVVCAVPLPVPTDTRNRNGQDGGCEGCEGPMWTLGDEEARKEQNVPGATQPSRKPQEVGDPVGEREVVLRSITRGKLRQRREQMIQAAQGRDPDPL